MEFFRENEVIACFNQLACPEARGKVEADLTVSGSITNGKKLGRSASALSNC